MRHWPFAAHAIVCACAAWSDPALAIAASPSEASIQTPIQTPRQTGNRVRPAAGAHTSTYEISDADWTARVRLPARAANDALVMIRSTAARPAEIDAAHVLFASSFKLLRGDVYTFQFNAQRKRWMPQKTARRQIQADWFDGQLPPPTAPLTMVRVDDTSWLPRVTLPASAGDRDRIVLVSSAAKPVDLVPDATLPDRAMRIASGQRYDFIYVKAESAWRPMAVPRVKLRAGQLPQGVIPSPATPVTEVVAANSNWAGELVLPGEARPGDVVIVKSTAEWEFQVRPVGPESVPRRVRSGDTVRFTFGDDGQWDGGTHVIDILLVYSDAAAARLGNRAMRMRLREGLRLTNEALENSRANVYFNAVGMLRRTVPGGGHTLDGVLTAIPSDAKIQAELDQRSADAVYYEGTEEGCGLGYLRADRTVMVAVGSLDCGTTVMRHELGHNLGLSHSDERAAPRYALGYRLHATVMGGNAIPYFSNPRVMHPLTGEFLGIPGRIDAVRAINERAREVAAFR